MDINDSELGMKFDFSKEARERRRELSNQRVETEPILEDSDRTTREFLSEIGKIDGKEGSFGKKSELVAILVDCLSAVG